MCIEWTTGESLKEHFKVVLEDPDLEWCKGRSHGSEGPKM